MRASPVASAGGCRCQERGHQTTQTDRLGAEIGPDERFAAGGRVALVENQVDHRQHGVQPRGHVVRVGHGERNAGLADLALGTHEALGHRGGWHHKRARDLVRFKATQRAERERDLGFVGEGRVAAGEDQPQAIVGDLGCGRSPALLRLESTRRRPEI